MQNKQTSAVTEDADSDFNNHLLTVARTTRQKICKDIEELSTMNQENLIGFSSTLHTTIKYMFFSIPWNIYQNRSYHAM